MYFYISDVVLGCTFVDSGPFPEGALFIVRFILKLLH